jgi:hypothetical protein
MGFVTHFDNETFSVKVITLFGLLLPITAINLLARIT